ncbi:MAG TPA: enolase C-terminal domain-like protein [candidate division Zixibacteria bacterium]|nr:enolase C-terminal domain-like protein [candidate division Zixibacteria bacterium]
MMQLDAVKVNLPLKKKFAVSQGEVTVKTNLLTILNNRYSGEASTSIYYGPSIEEMAADLRKGIALLERQTAVTLGTLHDIDRMDIHPAARSALMAAVLNYLSGESRRYPWELVDLGTPIGIKSSMTVGIDATDRMVEAIRSSEYPIIKVKMGHEQDVMILDALEAGLGKEVRVDANGAWSCAKAEEMIYHLSRKGVRVIEQPTDADYVKEWPHLKGKADVELIMDEGLNTLDDYMRCRASIDGINIKVDKAGGILHGVALARQAQADRKKVMLGCMVESSVGIAQSVYMSALADYFDLDGPLLLEDDIARGISYHRESINVDREIIGGPKLRRDVLQKYLSE